MTSEDRIARLAKAAGALVVLATIIAGVPTALTSTVGWPLPRAVPHLSDITSALNGQTIDDSFVVKSLAVACWLAWAQFSACVVAEAMAWRRGRGSRRIPLSGSLQPLVAQLVMTVALVLQVVPRPSVGSPVVFRAATAAEVREHAAPTGGTTSAEAAAAASPRLLRSYTVKPRDDLWTLAEKHLGDANRWRELFELNRGRPQPKGGALRHSWLIRTEWILQFPDDAVGLDEATATAVATPTAVPPTFPDSPVGDRLVRAVPPSTASVACAAPSALAPPVPGAPEESAAGSAEAEGHPAGAEEDTPVPSAQKVDAHGPDGAAEHHPEAAEQPRSSKAPAGLLAASLFAAGLVTTLERMRRAQRRRRRPGRVLRLPDPRVVPTEVAARRAATDSPAARLDVTLRLFAQRAKDRAATALPTVSTVQVGPDGRIEVLLAGALDAFPTPFTVEADGQVWTLPAGVSEDILTDAGHDVGAPLPGLVSVGHLSGTTVLIDLEAAGCTALVGADAHAGSLLRTMALEVATSLWADTVDVIVVSADPFPALDRVRVVPTIAEVVDDVAATAGALNDALARVGAPTTLAARLGGDAADGWIPTVVFCDNPAAESDAFTALVGLAAAGGRGLAVVAVGEVAEAGRVIRVGDGTVEVTPPGVVLESAGPTEPQLAAVEEILAVAADVEGGEASDDPTPVAPGGPEDVPRFDLPHTEDKVDVLVRILGAVEIEGARDTIDRRRAVELVVYLATHPGGVDDERLKTALWPDDHAPQSSFNTTVTRARSRLGTDADGVPHLPHLVATGGLYRLGPGVTTDFAALERHLAAARKSTPEAASRTLKTGLEFVRGVPFAGVRQGYEWAYAEGLVSRVEVVAAEAAHLLAQLARDARDADLAQWAACQGLLAAPGDEVLYRDRMLAFDLAGNPAGVEAVMDELVAVAEALEPYDTLHPETIALYNELSHRRRRTG